MAQLLIAVETFVTARRGRSEIINAGEIAGSRSWVVENNPKAFRELEVRWPDPVESAPRKSESAPAPEADLSTPKPVSPVSLGPPASPATVRKRGGGGRPHRAPVTGR